MKYLFLVNTFLISIYGFEINHGDKPKSITKIDTYNGGTFVYTNQEVEAPLFFFKNGNTGVMVQYVKPVIKTDQDTIVFNLWRKFNDWKDYRFQYSTSDLTTREEDGKHTKDPDGSEYLETEGSFSYVDSNGIRYIQGYKADKNGYHTKVSFGRKIIITEAASLSAGAAAPPRSSPKGIDGSLLCSLIGGGCKKR